LTTGCRQPEATGLYLALGYRGIFDPAADLEALRILSFEKQLAPLRESPCRPDGNFVAGSAGADPQR